MATTTEAFGELKLRSTSPPPLEESSGELEENNTTQNRSVETSTHRTGNEETGFSTIDLNGTSSAMNSNMSTSTSIGGSDLSYTSFEKPPGGGLYSVTNPTPPPHLNTKASLISGGGSGSVVVSPSNSSVSSSSPSMMSSPTNLVSAAGEVSSKIASRTVSTIDHIRSWSKSAYKCTRQIVSEKLGKCARTVDPEVENAIEQIRDVRRKYENVLMLASSLTANFREVVNSQRLLGENFAELAQKSSELVDEFSLNCESHRQLVKHGEALLESLNQFSSSLRTLCHKTIEDTLLTVRNYEAARLEYDAYKADLEELKSATTNNIQSDRQQQIRTLESQVNEFRDKYEKLKSDVVVKLRFLDENRVKVMRKQLVLFQHAIFAYYAGNSHALETLMRQFGNSTDSRLDRNPDAAHPTNKFQSFLEKN